MHKRTGTNGSELSEGRHGQQPATLRGGVPRFAFTASASLAAALCTPLPAHSATLCCDIDVATPGRRHCVERRRDAARTGKVAFTLGGHVDTGAV